jgi:hypothetical protein
VVTLLVAVELEIILGQLGQVQLHQELAVVTQQVVAVVL